METILSAVITGGMALAGVIISTMWSSKKTEANIRISQAVTDAKITELTREVREHNDFARRVPVRAQAVLEGALLQDVFAMTPYYWKTPRAGAQRLAATPRLESELAFDFLVYERI